MELKSYHERQSTSDFSNQQFKKKKIIQLVMLKHQYHNIYLLLNNICHLNSNLNAVIAKQGKPHTIQYISVKLSGRQI